MPTLDLLFFLKIGLIAVEFVYAIFAFVIIRQLGLMHKSFQTPYGVVFKLVAYIHFLAIVGLIIMSFVAL